MRHAGVRPSISQSYERVFHDTGTGAFFLHLRHPRRDDLSEELGAPRLERAIGVIYRPETELQSHYFQASLPTQFDEYIWMDATTAIHPLPSHQLPGSPDTFPFGLWGGMGNRPWSLARGPRASDDDGMTDVAIAVEGLCKRYGGVVAVDGVSFEVHRGEIFGLLGRNGCGKTTTVECLQGLRRADSGQLSVLGLDPRRHGMEIRRRIGAQLQESALPDRLKVWEALSFFASLARGGPPWEDVMEDWGLADKRNASFASLSGGQRQRLFVALAVVNQPELVFFDEMTTGLDPVSRHVAWELVDRLRQRGTTVLLVTHFMDEAEALCDRVAILAERRVAAVDTPAHLIERFGPTEVLFSAGGPIDFLERVPGVAAVQVIGPQVTVTGSGAVLAQVAAALVAHGQAPIDLRARRPTLEDVFLRLTSDHPTENLERPAGGSP